MHKSERIDMNNLTQRSYRYDNRLIHNFRQLSPRVRQLSWHVSFPKASAFERARKPEVELQIQIAASFHASLRNIKVEYCEPAE